ncbi:MAG: sensor histidine kinase [Novosphingobium sp.]
MAADEPLATLQVRCGGKLGGTIAIPELLAMARKARLYRLHLAQAIRAQDGQDDVTAWADVRPVADDGEGCEIALSNWQNRPVRVDDIASYGERRTAIDRHLAELNARLDEQQRIISAESTSVETQALAAAMNEAPGRPWTDFVAIPGSSHRQPMHWRLLDGVNVVVPGSDRTWRAGLLPLGRSQVAARGFELYLVADQPLDVPVQVGVREAKPAAAIGREVAPVLRQPIARIIANAETIRTRLAGPLADEYADYAADIASAGQHLLGLLDDLSDLEVVESEDFSTSPDHIDLSDVARRAAGILGVRAQERGITLDLPESDESVPAIGEFRRVLQILLNLVGNAIRYGPENSQIWLRVEQDGSRARITVADQGKGIAVENHEAIFEKFERLGRSGDGGSGLGLYISRRLARAMQGDLVVESAPGQGARFTLDLPADIYSVGEKVESEGTL